MNDDADLNKILLKRAMPAPNSNLVSRIAAAATINQKASLVGIIMQEVMGMIVIPRPAYALAVCLIFGLIIGSQIGGDISVATQDWFSFADIEEGDWL